MKIFSKRRIIIFIAFLMTAIALVTCLSAIKIKSAAANKIGLKVVIDAGHGGIDGGVTGVKTGIKESDLNLKMAYSLKKQFEEAGVTAVLTRKSEGGLYGAATKSRKKKDMQKRREIILKEKPDMVISLHMNRFSSSLRRGAQVFYDADSNSGKVLAKLIQDELNSMEESVRSYSELSGDYYILKCTEPSVIVECGFLSNPEDEALLITDGFRDKLSYAIFKGAVSYLTRTTFYANN